MSALVWREVEPQPVRPDVGPGLVDVLPKPLAQRRVQQVRGRVVALGRVPGGAIHVRSNPLAGLELASFEHDRDDLVVAETNHVVDPCAAVAVEALDVATVGDLAAPGGVERRLDELDQHPAVVRDRRADRGLDVGRLVAEEVGREPGFAGERLRALAEILAGPVAPGRSPRDACADPPSATRTPPRRPRDRARRRARALGRSGIRRCRASETRLRLRCPRRRSPSRGRSARRAACCPARASGRSSPPRRQATCGRCPAARRAPGTPSPSARQPAPA